MKIKSFVLAISLAALLSGPVYAANDKKLFIYTWDTYKNDDLFKKFEDETGIDVVTDIYSSNDALIAKLKAGGAYDVVMPSGPYIPLLASETLLQPLPADLQAYGEKMAATVKNPGFDPKNEHSLPLFWGTTGIAVNTKLVKEDITSWDQFFTRPDGEKKSLGVLDDTGTVMDVAALALGKPYCEDSADTYKAIQALLIKQKPFVKVYGATGYVERMAANDIAMQMAWSGDAYLARQQNKDIKYVYPKEGVEVWIDNLAIPSTSKNPENAKKFIEFVLKPENLAAYAEFSGYVPSMDAAKDLMPAEIKDAPEFNVPAGLNAPVSTTCAPKVVKNQQKIWERVLK
ncbi:MAG TPA: extracellular solute-binding protein [Patescibacteria group bacterium]|nr:extracellular solute-binding protein [Patescibacteria group bacterium]